MAKKKTKRAPKPAAKKTRKPKTLGVAKYRARATKPPRDFQTYEAVEQAPAAAPQATPVGEKPVDAKRDPRLPAVGDTLFRTFKGATYEVRFLERGVEVDGVPYRSLSALASKITGQESINGFAFFGLAKKAAS